MSIDKTTMKIFFEAMQGNMVGSGYSSKIVNTPMGPFKWNDMHQLWENVNNGMVMSNISLQDMMAMGYETSSGDNGNLGNGCIYQLGYSTIINTINYTYENQIDGNLYYTPSNYSGKTASNTCPTTIYANVDSITGSNPELLNGFVFKYRGATTAEDTSLSFDTDYIGLTLGINGTNVTIQRGERIGYAFSGVTTAFATVWKYTGSSFGNISFRLKVINKNTNQTLANTLVNFNNTDVEPILENSFGNLIGFTGQNTTYWASINGPQQTRLNGSTVGFSDIRPFITVKPVSTVTEGTSKNLTTFYYSIDDGPQLTSSISSGFTVGNNQTVRLGIQSLTDGANVDAATGYIALTNLSDNNNILASITWSYNYYTPPTPPAPE